MFKNKKVQFLALLLIIAFAGLLFFVLSQNESKANKQDEAAKQAQQETEANSEAKKAFVEENVSTSPNQRTDVPKGQPTDTTPVLAKSIDLSARQEPNSTVTVFSKLYGYSDGSCELKITNGARATSQNAPIIYQREFSSCAGFSVPINSVGTGNWTITLAVTSAGSTETKSISLEVK